MTDTNPTRERSWEGPLDETDQRFYDLRNGGYTDWIDQDGHPATTD